MSLEPRPARAVPTLWLNPETGEAIGPDGAGVTTLTGPVSLSAALDAASRYKAGRVMIAGAATPPARWGLGNAPGWKLAYCNVAGSWWARYEHNATEEKVWLRCIQEWGQAWAGLPLEAARAAFERLGHLVATLDRDHPLGGAQAGKNRAPVMLSPEATGLNLWALAVPDQIPAEPIAAELADKVRSTLAPARGDYVIQAPRTFPGYASAVTAGDALDAPLHTLGLVLPELLVCSELGIGPAAHLGESQARALFEATPYHPARYLVDFTIPEDWDGPGILATESEGKWRWPNRPGFSGQSWTGQAELRLAVAHGWASPADIAEAISFTHSVPSSRGKGKTTRPRPLDNWAKMIRGLWDEAAELPHTEPMRAALARIVTATIDAFGSSVEHSVITATRPEHVAAARALGDGRYAYQETAVERPSALRHPEFTAQVRSAVAARLLDGPSGGGKDGPRIGALHLPGSFYGARSGSIVTDQLPDWAAPAPVLGRWHAQGSAAPATVPATFPRPS